MKCLEHLAETHQTRRRTPQQSPSARPPPIHHIFTPPPDFCLLPKRFDTNLKSKCPANAANAPNLSWCKVEVSIFEFYYLIMDVSLRQPLWSHKAFCMEMSESWHIIHTFDIQQIPGDDLLFVSLAALMMSWDNVSVSFGLPLNRHNILMSSNCYNYPLDETFSAFWTWNPCTCDNQCSAAMELMIYSREGADITE